MEPVRTEVRQRPCLRATRQGSLVVSGTQHQNGAKPPMHPESLGCHPAQQPLAALQQVASLGGSLVVMVMPAPVEPVREVGVPPVAAAAMVAAAAAGEVDSGRGFPGSDSGCCGVRTSVTTRTRGLTPVAQGRATPR